MQKRSLAFTNPPTQDQVKAVLQDYLGEAGTVTVEDNALQAHLGKPSCALQSVVKAAFYLPPERSFFVTEQNGVFTVSYANQDDFTTNVASGFAFTLRRAFDGNETKSE